MSENIFEIDDHYRQQAAELLRNHANAAKCHNKDLLKVILEATKRPGGSLAEPRNPQATESKERRATLPLYDDLKKAILQNSVLLKCPCRLCIAGTGRKENEQRKIDMLFEEPGNKRLLNLATLVFCGCLFLFWDEAVMRHSDLYRFVHRNRSEEDIHNRLFLKFGPEPDKCGHYVFQMSTKQRREVADVRQVCSSCRWAIFSDAFDLKQSIVDVPILGIEWELGAELEDMSDKNMPFIHEVSTGDKGNNTHLFHSRIHPKFCLRIDSEPKNEQTLSTMNLFRKVYAYSITERGKGVARAKREAQIAHIMSSRQPENVARLLRAFTHKSSDSEFIELIYPKYTADLEDVFSGKCLWEAEGHPRSRSSSLELVDNPMWRALIQVVEAIKDMHDAIKAQKIKCLGHLDIKPANILVEKKPSGCSLRLTDFGRAAEYHSDHDGSVKRSTTAFAPPSLRPRDKDDHPRMGHYDVWSTACVLTQMLIFLNFGKDGLDLFKAQRKNQQDDAFWTYNGDRPELRPAVSTHLKKLRHSNGPRTCQMIQEGITKMLSLEDEDRLNIHESVEILKKTQDECKSQGQEQILCDSESWDVSASSLGLHRMSKVGVSIYRDSHRQMELVRRNWEKEKIAMKLDFGEGPPQWEKGLSCEILLIPQIFFEERHTSKLCCRFSSFHKNQVICFHRVGELLNFIAVTTSHQILPRKSPEDNLGIGLAMSKCIIKERGVFGKSHHFNSGRLQIWKALDDIEYEKLYPHSTSRQGNGGSTTSISGLSGRPTKSISMWKLVLWTARQHDNSTKEENVCLVVDIGVKTWKLHSKHQTKTSAHIRIERDNDDIRAVVFRPTLDKHNEEERYPGIPINPRQLDRDLNALRLSSIRIQLDDETDRDIFTETLRNHNFKL